MRVVGVRIVSGCRRIDTLTLSQRRCSCQASGTGVCSGWAVGRCSADHPARIQRAQAAWPSLKQQLVDQWETHNSPGLLL